jgi:hypothetical protein
MSVSGHADFAQTTQRSLDIDVASTLGYSDTATPWPIGNGIASIIAISAHKGDSVTDRAE